LLLYTTCAGEVEYTVYRDANGAVCDEDTPGAVGVKVSEAEVEKKGDG
jgi:leucyl-tRNA synthetase